MDEEIFVEPTYSEEFTARVNREERHHEVMLRGDQNTQIVLRNKPGAEGFVNGEKYLVSFTRVTEDGADVEVAEIQDETETPDETDNAGE